ncbi:MAG: phosphatase PAP2-related protein [archaeon]
MKKTSKLSQWKKELSEHKYLILLSILLLIISLVLEYFSSNYVGRIGGVTAPDLILDNLPTFDLDWVFIYGGALVTLLLLFYPVFFRVREVHRVVSQFSLLVLMRDAFITFTHLADPASALHFVAPKWFYIFTFQNGLFFSGHTAIPFLGFLLFKYSKIRYFFLAASIIMGCVVLMMHVHYTIDVFSAFFITYGTFKMGEWILKKLNNYIY